jgi:hypothetical protein
VLYVLVNNNYQLRAFLRHFAGRAAALARTTLIAVPHTLALDAVRETFGRLVVLETPMGRRAFPWLVRSYHAAAREAARQLSPAAEDVLLFFTEMEWLNQIVAQQFKAAGAKVVLLEDGGFGTYVPMGQPASDPLTLRERCVQAGFRMLSPLRRSRLFKVNCLLFPRLPDSAIDAIVLYRDAPIHRDTPVRHVASPAKTPCDVRADSAIFLNEPLYDYYQTREAYFAGLDKLLGGLSSGFGTVYFKFHPRETPAWRAEISEYVARRFPRVRIIETSASIEEIIAGYLPEVLASFFSAALLGIEYEGIEPMYLYHLVDDLVGQPVFASTTRILRSWGYRFVPSVDQIRSGYRSGLGVRRAGDVELPELIGGAAGLLR